MKNYQEFRSMLSLYVDGRYCECTAHSLPYLKGSVLMLPLHPVAVEMGYHVDHHHAEGYDLLYRDSVFEKKALTVRYVVSEKSSGTMAVSYYYQDGCYLEYPPVEILNDEIFVPMDLLPAALSCTCTASASGNINIRTVSAVKVDDEQHQKLLSDRAV